MPIYLDYNATAPVRPEVIERMQGLLTVPANPSSVHKFGRAARKSLEDARKVVAEAVSAWPNEIIFTASGTEANAMALRGFPDRRVLVSAVEHSSVLKPSLRGSETTEAIQKKNWVASPSDRNDVIPVHSSGLLDLSALDAMLAADETPALVSIMLANNETGVIQPISDIADLCKKHGALLHSDAVQAFGKIPVDFGALSVDLMTISGHKCGGPVGAAALVVRKDLAIMPLLIGGGQELNRRAGTENIPAVAGFARAVELFDFGQMQKLRRWLDGMESVILSERKRIEGSLRSLDFAQDDNIVFGKSAPRLPNTSCVAMPGVGQEVQLMDFDLKGFAVSAGSACSSGRIEVSHVLAAMGVDKGLAGNAIRISGGWATTEAEITAFTNAWRATCERLATKGKVA